eukprot:CAMPEP_0185037034 /NCGR_PEP_ID=MMETSP1103-20130426/30908_1 /TAXON_ID=36769 /ORGANISM="Paraphysomonas bandaiensis, Strain Caron Lab Isolate" /LENGTH=1442 /DNA_ID=CAMNT_0027574831 /DNA_START=372 /DNA_END=4697 /DNA_ORIENTATION=-
MIQWPYFSSSDNHYHPQTVEATAIFSDDPSISPWAGYNFLYLNFCSQDGWLGRSESLVNGAYLRGSTIFQAALSEVLNSTNRDNAELVLIGSGAGALGIFNHMRWIVDTLGFSEGQLSVVLDSYLSPITQTQPSKKLVDILPIVAEGYSPASELWVDGQPCALVYDCMQSMGYIPRGIKTLIIASSFDAAVFAFPSSASSEMTIEDKDLEGISKLISQYVTYSGSVVQSATSLYYDRVSSNITVFVAGCLHHVYITPIDPFRRDLRYKEVSAGLGRWKRSTNLDRFARVNSVIGPFRWFRVNFPGSSVEYGARVSPVQYPTGATLGEMVSIWARSNTPDIAGDLCGDTPQCGAFCNNEELTAARVPLREQLFRRLGFASISVLAIVLVVICVLLLTDGVHRRVGEEGLSDDKDDLVNTFVAQRRAKRLLEENDDDGTGEMVPSPGVQRSRGSGIAMARAAMNITFGKKRFARQQMTSGSSENQKLMNLLHQMDGHSALCWSGLKYHISAEESATISGSWGRLRYGRVTGILGPSGCGKSTLLKILSGRSRSGVLSASYIIKHLLLCSFELVSETGMGISLVHRDGEGTLVPHMTTEDNLFYRASLFASLRSSAETIHKHVDAILERCGLFSRKYTQVSKLTDGQRIRLLIGMELIANDSILFLDDPTRGLDASSSLEVMTVVQNEAMIQGKCIVVAMHQPRNELFELLDDLILIKGGKTIYCGSAFDFKSYIFDQLEESVYDSTSDRIVGHLEKHRDLFIPSQWDEDCVTTKMVKLDVVSKIVRSSQLVVPRAEERYLGKHEKSIQFERVSDMFVQFCNAITDSDGEQEFIPPDIVCELYADGIQNVSAADIVNQVNFVLDRHTSGEEEYIPVGVNVEQRNISYLLRRWLMKITIIIRRLWLVHDSLFYMGLFGLAVLVYPLMALLLMDGVGVNDLFLGLCFITFFPFFVLTLVVPSYMADNYRLIRNELDSGVYGALAVQLAFLGFYTFISICVALVIYFSIFVIHEHTNFWEVYRGVIILNMDMCFHASVIYLSTLVFDGDSRTVFIAISALLTVQMLLSGIFFRIHKFPGAVKAIMQINPIFNTAASFQHFYIGSCGVDYGDEKFCRNALMLTFGYEPYSEPSYGLFVLIVWTVLVNMLSIFVGVLRSWMEPGVKVQRRSMDGSGSRYLSHSLEHPGFSLDNGARNDDGNPLSSEVGAEEQQHNIDSSELDLGLESVEKEDVDSNHGQEKEATERTREVEMEDDRKEELVDGDSQEADIQHHSDMKNSNLDMEIEMISGELESKQSKESSTAGSILDDMSQVSSRDCPSPKTRPPLRNAVMTQESMAVIDVIDSALDDENAVVTTNNLFTCTQTVQSSGHEFAELCIVISFHQQVNSKKDIILGLSDSQLSMSVALVDSPDEEETISLFRMIDGETINSRFSKSNSTITVVAAIIDFDW